MAVLQQRSDLAPVRVGLVTRTHAPARWRLPLNAYVSRYPRQRRARFFEALNRSKAYVITVTYICHFAGISWDANVITVTGACPLRNSALRRSHECFGRNFSGNDPDSIREGIRCTN